MPWLHYIPVQLDYSDLYDILAFFRGPSPLNGELSNDHLAEKIASQGRLWSKNFYRRADMTAYMFRSASALTENRVLSNIYFLT